MLCRIIKKRFDPLLHWFCFVWHNLLSSLVFIHNVQSVPSSCITESFTHHYAVLCFAVTVLANICLDCALTGFGGFLYCWFEPDTFLLYYKIMPPVLYWTYLNTFLALRLSTNWIGRLWLPVVATITVLLFTNI